MNDENWIRRARETLDASVRDLDAASASRLNRARHKALSQTRRQRWHSPAWAAVAASLLALVAVSALWHGDPQAPDSQETGVAEQAVPVEDLELLVADADLELLDELEFYLWLAAELPEESVADDA